MKHIECKTMQGRNAEADFYNKSGKEWVKVKLFGYHAEYEFCTESTSLNDALKYLDDNIEAIEKAESDYLDKQERCND